MPAPGAAGSDPERSGAAQPARRAARVDVETLGQYEAVRLFIERARRGPPGFRGHERERAGGRRDLRAARRDAAGHRARRGARQAARSRRDPGAARAPARRCSAAGSRDLPERQQTLRGAIAWSYDLLDDGARRLLDGCPCSPAGSTWRRPRRSAARPDDVGVDVLDGLSGLVDKSLVKATDARRRAAFPDARDHPRIRRGAASSSERRAGLVLGRHRDWFTALASRAAAGAGGRWTADLAGPAGPRITMTSAPCWTGQSVSRTQPSRSASHSRCGGSGRSGGHLVEARRRLEAMAAAPWSHEDPRLRAKLMEALGGTCWWQGEIGPMGACYDRGARAVVGHR